MAVGPNVKPFETPPALIDMAPTLVAALDAPTAAKPSGRILHEIVGAEAHLTEREATEVSPRSTGEAELLYRITVTLDRQTVAAYVHDQALAQGMQLEADVLLDRRRLIEWLFEPLLGLAQRV